MVMENICKISNVAQLGSRVSSERRKGSSSKVIAKRFTRKEFKNNSDPRNAC
jgi:hypothetical protein